MNINDIYSFAILNENKFSITIIVLFLVAFMCIVVIDAFKWRYYGKK